VVTDTTEVVAEETDGLPEADYGGPSFTMLIHDGQKYEFDVESENGEIVNNAVEQVKFVEVSVDSYEPVSVENGTLQITTLSDTPVIKHWCCKVIRIVQWQEKTFWSLLYFYHVQLLIWLMGRKLAVAS